MPTPSKPSFFNTMKAKIGFGRDRTDEVARSGYNYTDTLTTTSLMGGGAISARNRQQIYQKYQQMMADPVVSSALRVHVTSALGGHETSGDVVFIETSPAAKGNSQAERIVQELSAQLSPLFNKIAQSVTYNGCGYGDAYARLYPKKNKGIMDISVDEMMLPSLIQPYEVGNKTVVCVTAIGDKFYERLAMDQIARLKMPRMIYTPQPLAVEKAWRTKVLEDDVENLPVMPSLIGGSFLADAETQYDKFISAMQGLVGQRVLDSIDESMFTVEIAGMSKEQRQGFMNSVEKMLRASKKLADDAVKSGVPMLSRVRHIIPVAQGKQLLQVQGLNSGGGSGSGRAGNISVDDVLFHAKLLSGALGVDITMVGFADMLSGGLGDGGFLRTSIQAAERSRTIRIALSEFFNHIVDVHLMYKTGQTYPVDKRPWQINFYGAISSLEAERARTKSESINGAMLLAQVFAQIKDSGLEEEAIAHYLERECRMEKEDASMYAKDIAKAKEIPQEDGFGGGAGGGFGGQGGPQ